MYIKLSDQSYPVSLRVIKAEYPSTSFPKEPTDEQLAPYGYANVFESAPPTYDANTHKLEEDAPVNDGSKWDQAWVLIALTQTELDANLQRAKDSKYSEIWSYADSINNDAENTFITNNGANTGRTRERNNKKHSKLSNKKFRSETLSDDEDAWFDRYDELLDYHDSVYDIADLAEDAVEKMNDINSVNNYDVINTPEWPEWI